jgi:hypothetical protein
MSTRHNSRHILAEAYASSRPNPPDKSVWFRDRRSLHVCNGLPLDLTFVLQDCKLSFPEAAIVIPLAELPLETAVSEVSVSNCESADR